MQNKYLAITGFLPARLPKHAERCDESGSRSRQDSKAFPLSGMRVVQPLNPSSDNFVSVLAGSHQKTSSQGVMYVQGILNKAE